MRARVSVCGEEGLQISLSLFAPLCPGFVLGGFRETYVNRGATPQFRHAAAPHSSLFAPPSFLFAFSRTNARFWHIFVFAMSALACPALCWPFSFFGFVLRAVTPMLDFFWGDFLENE